jgi:ubiquinone/menaquinone biosynthesis C-methylase UbiE
MADVPYLHGFTAEEQQRLIEQSLFLEPWVYAGMDLSRVTNLLEIGAGVGAQTAILLKKFPHLNITCIDHSPYQLKKAEQYLADYPMFKGRYTLKQMKGEKLDFKDEAFDGVYFCWVLEHVNNPDAVIKEAFRVLQPNGELFASEVFNSTFYTFPKMPNISHFWKEYNKFQIEAGGDPDMGAKLGHKLTNAGFKQVSTESRSFMADHRDLVQKKEIIDYWTTLLLSGGPNLLEAGYIQQNVLDMLKKEFSMLNEDPEGVFYCSFIRAFAKKL